MITVKTNINVTTTSLLRKLEILKNPKPLLRLVAADVVVMMVERIHEKGEAADGTQMGTYNKQYLYLRQKKYKRGGSDKIIVSLTRQLENNWSVIGTANGWGIGFTNLINAQKLIWVEEQKKKKIGALTKSEKEYALNKLQSLVKKELE